MSSKPRVPNVCETPPKELRKKLIRFASRVRPEDQLACAALLVATSGLRAGEVLALTWNDIDRRSGMAHVRLANFEGRGICQCKIPRRVETPDYALYALGRLRAAQGERLGECWDAALTVVHDGATLAALSVPVVCTPYGHPICPRELTCWWWKRRGGFDFEDWTLADLRKAGQILDASDEKVEW